MGNLKLNGITDYSSFCVIYTSMTKTEYSDAKLANVHFKKKGPHSREKECFACNLGSCKFKITHSYHSQMITKLFNIMC